MEEQKHRTKPVALWLGSGQVVVLAREAVGEATSCSVGSRLFSVAASVGCIYSVSSSAWARCLFFTGQWLICVFFLNLLTELAGQKVPSA